MEVHGACHCGLISFVAEIDPNRVMVCHCTDCQVLSGAPLRVAVAASIETFVLHGTPKSYVKVADSGNRRAQMFCPECGTPLFATAPENPTSVIIRLGCVKERAALVPAAQVWQRSSMPWLPELPHIPRVSERVAPGLWVKAEAVRTLANFDPRQQVSVARVERIHLGVIAPRQPQNLAVC